MQQFFLRIQRPLRRMRPAQIIVLVFLAIILLGAALLMLPAASESGQPTDFLTALFTATSATCVTGLIVVDTGVYWSAFGKTVILIMIQIGGLGFMTIASIFFFALRQKIGLKQRLVLSQAFSMDDMSGIVRFVKNVLLGTLVVEGAGAVVLCLRFWPEFGFLRALKYGVFHSISAFCNAGFDILGDLEAGGSLCRYVADPVVNITVMLLIVIGGLGFAVWGDVRKNRRFSRLTVYTRLVLLITAGLIFGGAAIFALLEWNNPGTIGNLTPGGKILASLFQSVTLRTAGFTTIDQNALGDVSKAVSDLLMFIGGSSGSTAGGVKTVTIGVVILYAVGTARGRSQVTAFGRAVAPRDVSHAVAIVLLVFALAILGGGFISVCDKVSLENSLYETISALCTVGLTTGITGSLGTASRFLIIIYMFFGRVGIMTISVGFMAANPASERTQYAQTKIMIG
ncbi:MAG: TrkH family potassium uptake protein [Oscillospiraceae bacterium]